MAPAKPIYDLTVLLDADAPSERRAEILAGVEQAIGNGGEIVGKHDWGVRTLAYEIEHHKEAEYHLIQLTAPPELLERLRNTLRVTDGVLRHRIIRLPSNMQPPPALRPEPRAESAPAEAAPGEAPPAEAPPAPAAESAPAPEAPAAEAPAAEAPAPEAPAPEAPAAEAPVAEAPAEAAPAEAAPAEEPAPE
jgi:small subunit ribosomal protein S6